MIKEIEAKSALHFHEQTFASNWDINIFRGCAHKCRYCFAQYSHKYIDGGNFFDDIYVKTNIPEIVNREFAKKSWRKSAVTVCGVSDCYQPVEKDYKIMPKVLDVFRKNKNPIIISTKSNLALRDIKQIEELKKVTDVYITTSISTMDEDLRKLIEPGATTTSLERLEMLGEFSKRTPRRYKKIGCKTTLLFIPIIPYITDDFENLDKTIRIAKSFDVDNMHTWPLHLRGQTKPVFLSFIQKYFPELYIKYVKLYKKGNVSQEYLHQLQKTLYNIRIKYDMFNRFEEITEPEKDEDSQLTLF